MASSPIGALPRRRIGIASCACDAVIANADVSRTK
jgi:hypothetical protein